MQITMKKYNTTVEFIATNLEIHAPDSQSKNLRSLNESGVFSNRINGRFDLNATIDKDDIFKITLSNLSHAKDQWGNVVKTQNVNVKSKFIKPYESESMYITQLVSKFQKPLRQLCHTAPSHHS